VKRAVEEAIPVTTVRMALLRSANRRTVVAIIVLSALLISLTGCGEPIDDAGAPGVATEQPGSTPEPPPTTVADPTEGEGTTTVSVFFVNPDLGDPCGEVFSVQREVSAEDPIGEALAELLEGPTAAETAEGHGGWFSADTAGMLHGYRAEGDVLHVDFADFSGVIPNASTSCGSAGLLAQLDRTVLQFGSASGFTQVRYSFDGSAEAFYEWLQLDVPGGTDGSSSAAPPPAPPAAPAPDPSPEVRYGEEPPANWDVTRVSAGERLNVRSGPGVQHTVTGTLAHDAAELESTGRIAHVGTALWRELKGATIGWVNAHYLMETPAPPPQVRYGEEPPANWNVTGVTASDRLNVRSGPGVHNPVVGTLAHDAVELESTGRIAHVGTALWRELKGATVGWVNAQYLDAM
jgi:uncharacterized protein YraI